jgi:hypothetical protein
MIDAVCGNPQRKCPDSGNRRLPAGTLCHHAWHRLDISPQPAVFFAPHSNRNRVWSCDFHAILH